jgi:hypothetical protein
MPTIPRLVELGMVPAVARETVNQFSAAVSPSARRFIEHGVPAELAQELATQSTGAKSARRLIEFGMAPGLAAEVVN